MAGTSAADYADRKAGSATVAPSAGAINYNQPKYIGSGIGPAQTSINYNQPAYIGSGVAPAPRPTSINYNQPKYIGSGIGPNGPVTPPASGPSVYPSPDIPAPQTTQRSQYAPGGMQEYNNLFSPEQQQVAQNQYLSGDSDYTAQIGLYQKALDDFITRITGRITGFNDDATQAIAGNQKNEAMSADSLGADFGARGLSYSGLYTQADDKLRNRYLESRTNIGKNRDTNIQNAKNEQADYTAENEISRKNAERSSLLRMAAQQQLKDSNW